MALIGKIVNTLMESEADALLTKKVQSFKGKLFATGDDGDLFGELSDINGFKFLNFKILGPLNVHIYNGCKIIFESASKKHEIESDSLEIYTDYSKKLNLGITEFDIDLVEELENILRNETITSIQISINKKILSFTPDMVILKEILDNAVEPGESEMGNESMDPFLAGV